MEERTAAASSSRRSDNSETTTTDMGSGRRSHSLEEATATAAVVDSNTDKVVVFVAVGKDIKRSKSTLGWALQHAAASGRDKICILHVHRPVDSISILGAKFPISKQSSEKEVKARKEKEKREMAKLLDEYNRICNKAGVEADKPVFIDSVSIEKGIVEIIKQHGVCRLVMGAASDRHYSRKMTQPKSRKAIHVMQQAAETCHIWFVCKGRLIHTRTMIVSSQSGSGRRSSINIIPHPSSLMISNSQRWYSESSGFSTPRSQSVSSNISSSSAAVSYYDEIDRSSDGGSSFRLNNGGVVVIQEVNEEDNEEAGGTGTTNNNPSGHELIESPRRGHEVIGSSRVPSLVKDQLYEKLDQAMAEAQLSKTKAIEEAMKRRKAEENTIDLNHKMKVIERAYFDELKRRKETEYELLKTEERVTSLKRERDELSAKLRIMMEERLMLETRLEGSSVLTKEMENQVCSVFEFLKQYRAT